MGCGRVGASLARGLEVRGHSVAVIDANSEAFRRLGSGFKGITVRGVGFDREVLEQALSRAGFGELEWDTVFHMSKTAADGQERVFPIFLVTARKLGARSHQTVGE